MIFKIEAVRAEAKMAARVVVALRFLGADSIIYTLVDLMPFD